MKLKLKSIFLNDGQPSAYLTVEGADPLTQLPVKLPHADVRHLTIDDIESLAIAEWKKATGAQ
ncbi:hypothetical protein [Burkholderia cepacia]|uniref:hypothetical protein n=1 Tax=Burkholderia cepacia TaxID=292 RepID=UPI0012D9AFA1|nr:hypothetical protein [Burkholderia cepacia]